MRTKEVYVVTLTLLPIEQNNRGFSKCFANVTMWHTHPFGVYVWCMGV